MIAPFIFLGFIDFALCANKSERKSHKLSDFDTCNVFGNHSDLNYENPQVNYQNESGPGLFDSGLNRNNEVTKVGSFVPHNQEAKLNQCVGQPVYFGYTIPNLTIFGKIPLKTQKQETSSLQVPISKFYSTASNQQFAINQASFRPIILFQNPAFIQNLGIPSNKLESNETNKTFNCPQINNQTTLTSYPQPSPTSSRQLQEFQNRLTGSNLQLDLTKRALTEQVKLAHEISKDLDVHKANNGESNQSPTKRKCLPKLWKAYELNNLLKGVNECGTNWKKILNLYKFGEGRTEMHLHGQFSSLKRRGRIVHTKEAGWKFVNRGELTDSVRGEGENEQIQRKKRIQGDAELINNKSKDDLSDLVQHSVNELFDQEQEQKGLSFVIANKKRPYTPWKDYEISNLIKGVNVYGKKWKIIHKSLEFEQGRTFNNLACQFFILKKHNQIALDEDSSWKFVSGKGQKQVEKRKRRRYQLLWKKYELDNLLKGVNKYGRNWKKIFDSYEFEGRSSKKLCCQFIIMESKGQITYEENVGWNFTDSYKEKIHNKVVFEGELMKGLFNDETH